MIFTPNRTQVCERMEKARVPTRLAEGTILSSSVGHFATVSLCVAYVI